MEKLLRDRKENEICLDSQDQSIYFTVSTERSNHCKMKDEDDNNLQELKEKV